MENAEKYIERWKSVGLLDEGTAQAIRAYERAQAKPGSRQWQVLLALAIGGMLLGAGVLLFVAAHWDEISPLSRMALVLSMLVFFHGLGLLVCKRFAGFATAMHTLGTISAGAAVIALVGQIFNMQEHWPDAILLWALCAAAGWILLWDEFQETLTLLLVPAWISCEWTVHTAHYGGADVYRARAMAVIGVVSMVAFLHSRRRVVFGILFACGAVLLPFAIFFLAEGWQGVGYPQQLGFVPLSYRLASCGVMLLAMLAGWLLEKQSIVPATVTAALVFILPWAQRTIVENPAGHSWTHLETSLLAYVLVASSAVFLVWWGVRQSAKPLVNYGMVAFAMTVIWFYFSSVMDKLGRSLGLIMLGVLFLAGGWVLEGARRRLVSSMAGASL